jgi:hypothetical protein
MPDDREAGGGCEGQGRCVASPLPSTGGQDAARGGPVAVAHSIGPIDDRAGVFADDRAGVFADDSARVPG